jgi:hypothetical protein
MNVPRLHATTQSPPYMLRNECMVSTAASAMSRGDAVHSLRSMYGSRRDNAAAVVSSCYVTEVPRLLSNIAASTVAAT